LKSVDIQGLFQPFAGGASYFQAPALDRVGACFYLEDILGKQMSGSLMKLLCTNKLPVHWSHIIKYSLLELYQVLRRLNESV